MKRSYIGFALVLTLLILGLLGSTALSRIHIPLAQTAAQAAGEAETGNLPAARELVRQVRAQWDAHGTVRRALMDHRTLDQVESLLAELEAHDARAQPGSFAAACRKLAQALENVARDHALTWENLL